MKTLAFFFALMSTLSAKEKPLSVTFPEFKFGDKIYHFVTISLRAPNEARISHQDGSRLVNPALLSQEVQKTIGYNEELSAKTTVFQAYMAAQQKIAARNALLISEASEITAQVINSTALGILCMCGSEIVFIETPSDVTGYISDQYYRFRVYENGVFEYTTILGASKTVRKLTDVRVLTGSK